ncbi:MAG: hypothetical protein NTV74_06210 [Euryarchaeota archaeon]|nr:hypothetical protein [Euryarchaeota archaeon]
MWKKSKGEQSGLELTGNQKKIIIASVLVVIVANVSLFSGFELGMFRKGMSMKELYEHQEQYINKTITLRGSLIERILPPDFNISNISYNQIPPGYNFVDIFQVDEEVMGMYYAWIPNNISLPVPFVTANTYLFTGIVRYAKLPWETYTTNAEYFYYLEVTKIETT